MNYKVKTLALLLAVAAGNSARAQQATYAQGCKSYTFTGSNASGSGDITYQWYRDGQPISGATGKDYILPVKQAYGENVEFKRGVVSSGCVGEVAFSAPVYLTFSGVKTTVCWANTNVDAYQTFASKPDMYTKFYQWNRDTAWAATGKLSKWHAVSITDDSLTVNPCPDGWRLPTLDEFTALQDTGSTWATARTKGNAVAGRFYGHKHETCALPNNMNNCIFLPAVGYRNGEDGSLSSEGTYGYYWSSTQVNSTSVYSLAFDSHSSLKYNGSKAHVFSVRCVQ